MKGLKRRGAGWNGGRLWRQNLLYFDDLDSWSQM